MKLHTTSAAVAAAFAALTIAGSASAQDNSVAFNAAVTSDYVFRGFSQTAEDPAVQAGLDVTAGSFYVGVWASNVDFGDSTNAEIDLYAGYRGETQGFAFDVGVVGYGYTGSPSLPGAGYDYMEYKAAVSRAVGPVTAGVAVYYSPDFFGVDDEATYLEGNVAFTPVAKWTVTGAVGKQMLDVTDDYATWNVGAAYAITDNLVADVRYHGTDVDNAPLADDRIVGTIKVLF